MKLNVWQLKCIIKYLSWCEHVCILRVVFSCNKISLIKSLYSYLKLWYS